VNYTPILRDFEGECKMNEKYFRLWVLLREKIARKAGRPDAERYQSEQVLMDELLRTMAILEAEAILEE